MIIHLCITEYSYNALSEEKRAAFSSQVVHLVSRGRHIIVCSRPVIRLQMGVLTDPFSQSVLRRLHHNQTQTGNIYHDAPIYVRVADEVQAEKPEVIDISLSDFINGALAEPVLLVSENQAMDGVLFEQAMKKMGQKLGLPNIRLFHSHGGGADCKNVVKRLIDEGKMFLVIVDSDKKTPVSNMGALAKTLKEMMENYSVGKCIILPCHEVENLLTDDELRLLDQWNSHSDVQSITNFFTNARENKCELFLYFDFKKGIKKNSLGGDEENKWIERKLGEYNVDVIDGLGENVLRTFVDRDKAISTFRKTVETKFWRKHFGPFFEEACYWFAGSREIRM